MNINKFVSSANLDEILSKEGFSERGDRYIRISDDAACIVYKRSRNIVASRLFESLINKWRENNLLEMK